MKAVPAKVVALGLAILLASCALLFLGGQPKRAAAESLQVTSVAERNASGLVQLRVEWHWDPHVGRPQRLSGHEELLGVSYDTQELVWLGEQAPAGIGANGETLRRLEKAAGSDGARRLFVIPEGEDGHVTLQFQPRQPGTAPVVEPFHVYVAFASPSSHVLVSEAALPSDDSQLASMNRTSR